MGSFTVKDHTFVVCAYKENKYLDNCVRSLMEQEVKNKIIICTSTPNNYIQSIADKYGLELYINPNPSSLSGDWNFAARQAKTRLYTLCHQDDYYFKDYLKDVLEYANNASNPIFIYTNYMEDKKEGLVKDNLNLKIKNILNWPMKFKANWSNKFIRRRCLSFGNPICCPAVTFNKDFVKDDFFDKTFKNAADWDAWERLSKLDGDVVYCPNYLMAHRIYDESTTSENIKNNIRTKEDNIIFKRFWPTLIANLLTKLFKYSEKSNG